GRVRLGEELEEVFLSALFREARGALREGIAIPQARPLSDHGRDDAGAILLETSLRRGDTLAESLSVRDLFLKASRRCLSAELLEGAEELCADALVLCTI